mmetsp:Transcript_5149/g.7916  ORF Transcript_5149/g.7916 Transcript_5149/m.7916 type:complete len:100 (+) Transcript_5149:3572-3871(+)
MRSIEPPDDFFQESSKQTSGEEISQFSSISTPKLNQPCVFEMREKQELELLTIENDEIEVKPKVQIQKYNSVQDYEQFLLRHENMTDLKGCFDRDNTYG